MTTPFLLSSSEIFDKLVQFGVVISETQARKTSLLYTRWLIAYNFDVSQREFDISHFQLLMLNLNIDISKPLHNPLEIKDVLYIDRAYRQSKDKNISYQELLNIALKDNYSNANLDKCRGVY